MRSKNTILIAAVLILLAGVFVGLILLTLYRMDRPPVPREAFERLNAGMSQSEVVETLGEPSAVWNNGTWVYVKEGSWVSVYLWFDEEEKLDRFDWDN